MLIDSRRIDGEGNERDEGEDCCGGIGSWYGGVVGRWVEGGCGAARRCGSGDGAARGRSVREEGDDQQPEPAERSRYELRRAAGDARRGVRLGGGSIHPGTAPERVRQGQVWR